MKLAEAIFKLDGLPDEAHLYVQRIGGHFTPESYTVILTPNEEELQMKTTEFAALKAPGTEYFLLAYTVRDMVDDWRATPNTSGDTAQLINIIIHYAQHDA